MFRIVLINRNRETSSDSPTYDIVGAGRLSPPSDLADTSSALSTQAVRDWLIHENVPELTVDRVLRELSQTGASQVWLLPSIGPRIVRAWFDTVFNPLIPSLEMEIRLLDRRNWTFSFSPPTLDLIRPIRRYLREEAEANLDQILELNPALTVNVRLHDEVAKSLLAKVTDLHRSLLADRNFIDLCTSLLNSDRLRAIGISDSREIFGAYSLSDRLQLIAVYVVNGTGELLPHFSTARFWNSNRERLIQCLTLPDVRDLYESTVEVGTHLSGESSRLLHCIKDLRLELSLRHDVPYVKDRRDRLTA